MTKFCANCHIFMKFIYITIHRRVFIHKFSTVCVKISFRMNYPHPSSVSKLYPCMGSGINDRKKITTTK